MFSLFNKWLGIKEKNPANFLEQFLQELLDKGGFELSFDLKINDKNSSRKEIFINLFGEDENLLKINHGRFLLALQTYCNRLIQHHFLNKKFFIRVDSSSYFEDKDKRLLDLAQRLKKKALYTRQPVYFKSLPPNLRRKVHQFLSEDAKVHTSSVGDGFYKNICITPNDSANRSIN